MNWKVKLVAITGSLWLSPPLTASEVSDTVDTELLLFLGGWELNETESMTPLEWQALLDATDTTSSQVSSEQTSGAAEVSHHED